MLNANDIRKYTIDTIEQSKRNYKKMLNFELSSQNYMFFLSMIVNEENYTKTMIDQLIFWQYVSNSEEIRKESSKAELEFSKYIIEIYTNEYMYIKLLKYYQVFASKLSILQRRYLRNYIRSYEMSGASLHKDNKKKLREIDNKLVTIERTFVENIGNCNKTILLSDEELNGLPKSKLDSLPIDKKTGKRIIDFKYPTYKSCMKYINNSDVRKIIDYEYHTICKEINTKLLVEILLLRHLKAELLNRKNHASLMQEQLMIKEPENVNSFLNDMHPIFDMLFLEEFRFLLRLKEQDYKIKKINFDNIINPWDISYYFNLAERKIIGDEVENLSDYFSLEQVKKICFNLCKHLFGVKFVKKTCYEGVDNNIWHLDVEIYSLVDDKSNTKLGTMYLDLFPRDNKYNHMACFSIIPYCEYYDEEMNSANIQYPSIAIVGNFTPSYENVPSLLTHNELITFFHEIGHVLHSVCGRIGFSRLSGTNVEHDFVEVPSQILENWCWEKNVLNQFKHWKNNDFLSDKIIGRLIKKRTLQNGFHYKRQLALSKFDQIIHSYEPLIKKLQEVKLESAEKILINTFKTVYDEVCKSNKIKSPKFSINIQEGTFMPANWGHLVGYDAKYYCYLWSEVFADCMFNAKFKNNIFDKKAGLEYRTIILNTGGSVRANIMIQNFIKNKPSLESFFENKIYVVRGALDNDDYTSETSTEMNGINPISMIKYEKPAVNLN